MGEIPSLSLPLLYSHRYLAYSSCKVSWVSHTYSHTSRPAVNCRGEYKWQYALWDERVYIAHKLVKVVLRICAIRGRYGMRARVAPACARRSTSFCSRWDVQGLHLILYIYVLPVWYRESLVSSYTYMVLGCQRRVLLG